MAQRPHRPPKSFGGNRVFSKGTPDQSSNVAPVQATSHLSTQAPAQQGQASYAPQYPPYTGFATHQQVMGHPQPPHRYVAPRQPYSGAMGMYGQPPQQPPTQPSQQAPTQATGPPQSLIMNRGPPRRMAATSQQPAQPPQPQPPASRGPQGVGSRSGGPIPPRAPMGMQYGAPPSHPSASASTGGPIKGPVTSGSLRMPVVPSQQQAPPQTGHGGGPPIVPSSQQVPSSVQSTMAPPSNQAPMGVGVQLSGVQMGTVGVQMQPPVTQSQPIPPSHRGGGIQPPLSQNPAPVQTSSQAPPTMGGGGRPQTQQPPQSPAKKSPVMRKPQGKRPPHTKVWLEFTKQKPDPIIASWARVRQVFSGDLLRLAIRRQSMSATDTTLFTLAGVRPPRVKRHTSQDDDQAYGYEAREFVRSKVMDRNVYWAAWDADAQQPDGNKAAPRHYGDIYIEMNGKRQSLSMMLVSAGYASVDNGRSRLSDFERTSLLKAEEKAKAKKIGMWAKDKDKKHIRKVEWVNERERKEKVFESLKGKKLEAIVERVVSGSTLQVEVIKSPMDHIIMYVHLAGCTAPSTRDNSPNSPGGKRARNRDSEKNIARAAREFSSQRLLGRRITLKLIAYEPKGNLHAQVWHPFGQIAPALLKAGFARYAPWTAKLCDSSEQKKLSDALADAKQTKRGLYVNFDPSQDEFKAIVMEIQSGDRIVVRRAGSSEDETITLASIRAPKELPRHLQAKAEAERAAKKEAAAKKKDGAKKSNDDSKGKSKKHESASGSGKGKSAGKSNEKSGKGKDKGKDKGKGNTGKGKDKGGSKDKGAKTKGKGGGGKGKSAKGSDAAASKDKSGGSKGKKKGDSKSSKKSGGSGSDKKKSGDSKSPKKTSSSSRDKKKSSKQSTSMSDEERQKAQAHFVKFASASKEFLRSRLIGKSVDVFMEYTKSPANSFAKDDVRKQPNASAREQRFATVKLGKDNIAELLVRNGLAQVIQHRDADPRSRDFDRLWAAEKYAKDRKKGYHDDKRAPKPVIDLTDEWGSLTANQRQSLKQYFEKEVQGIIEYVWRGDRLKVFIPDRNVFIRVSLAYCRAGVPKPYGVPIQKWQDPFADQAKEFARKQLMQREVNLQVVDRIDAAKENQSPTWLAHIYMDRKNFAIELLKSGLGRVQMPPRRTQETRSSGKRGKRRNTARSGQKETAKEKEKRSTAELYRKSEDKARKHDRGIWQEEKARERAQEEKLQKDSGKEFTVQVSHIQNASTFWVCPDSAALAKIEEEMSKIKIHEVPRGAREVAVLWNETSYCRAKLIRQDGDRYYCLFVDYGTRDWVEGKHCVALPHNLTLENVPQVAQRCNLAGVRAPPSNVQHWWDAGRRFGEIAMNKDLTLKILASNHDKRSNQDQWSVELFDDEGKSLNEILAQDGYLRIDEQRRDTPERFYKMQARKDELICDYVKRIESAISSASIAKKGMYVDGKPIDSDAETPGYVY